MSELDDLVDKKLREGLRRLVLDNGGDGRDLAAMGLWCSFCGADSGFGDHQCGPDLVEKKGLTP